MRSGNSQGRFTNDAEVKGFAYLERAVDAGVDIRVVNNSWGVEGIANRALYLAAESLGAKGVAVVFASGNDSLNVDKGLDTAKIQGASDYVTVVNSSMMTGVASSFTNYGKTATDVFAPGTSILSTANSKGSASTSTFIPSLIKDKSSLAAYGDFSEGSTEIEAWTGIFQVSGGKATESKVGQVDTFLLNSDGTEFESIGKRVNYTPTVYSRAFAYRGMLYVLGHDYSNSYGTVMRATAVATNELPGDVVRGGGSGGEVPGGEPADVPDPDGKGALAKTSDAAAPVAAVAAAMLAAGCLAAMTARRASRKGAARK